MDSILENSRTIVSPPAAYAARNWAQILARYREPNHARSIVEIVITSAPLAALWTLAWAAIHFGYWWLALLLAVPAAGFLVRLFTIQHDCGHGSFFRNRIANDWVGRVIGVLTLTPYDFWRRTHAIHHASSGHLERRGIGDVDTLTVREYLSLSFWGRLRYRAYRHPLVMFCIGPAYLFILRHRLPVGLIGSGWQRWLSTMATNVAIAAIAAGLICVIGVGPFLLVELPIILLAGSIGVWLFYVQHQFEMTFWAHDGEWTFQEAALHGSSHYDLPGILRWFTANIGVHHVHHLCSRIPYYRLPRALRDHPELCGVSRLTLLQSFRCMRLVLWDEDRRRLISFREMGHRCNGTVPTTTRYRASVEKGGHKTINGAPCERVHSRPHRDDPVRPRGKFRTRHNISRQILATTHNPKSSRICDSAISAFKAFVGLVGFLVSRTARCYLVLTPS